ncbi:hypothetical protein [Aquimarina spinulae]|uniref:hypothetical protein n=1 Tax=Aquimarina spinulae TaxID=1192023 RepID=UPI000A6CA9B1|nr:hypothetical protein [Aquimarina spinulae]
MKKKNLKSLKLNKKSISKLGLTQVKGGATGGCSGPSEISCVNTCPAKCWP